MSDGKACWVCSSRNTYTCVPCGEAEIECDGCGFAVCTGCFDDDRGLCTDCAELAAIPCAVCGSRRRTEGGACAFCHVGQPESDLDLRDPLWEAERIADELERER